MNDQFKLQRDCGTAHQFFLTYSSYGSMIQAASHIVDCINGLPKGKTCFSFETESLPVEVFINNIKKLSERRYVFTGEVVSKFIWEANNELTFFRRETSLGWVFVKVYNFNDLLSTDLISSPLALSFGVVGRDIRNIERQHGNIVPLEDLAIDLWEKTGASGFFGGRDTHLLFTEFSEYKSDFNEFLSPISIVEKAELPEDYEAIFSKYNVGRYFSINDEQIYLNIWESWRGGQHSDYDAIAESLGKKSLWSLSKG